MEENFIVSLINSLMPDRDLRGNSVNLANWMSVLLPNTCRTCVENHGRIIDIAILNSKEEVEAHRNCQCLYVPMRTKLVGFVTDLGYEGADVYLKDFGILPDYYVDKETALKAGWQTIKKKLSSVLPGKMIGGDIYDNDDFKLPSTPGRVWYEADINYKSGKRNRQRIVYSNDGLMFATYDHFLTFYEITE